MASLEKRSTISGEYAVLLRWDNIYYEKPTKKAKTIKKLREKSKIASIAT